MQFFVRTKAITILHFLIAGSFYFSKDSEQTCSYDFVHFVIVCNFSLLLQQQKNHFSKSKDKFFDSAALWTLNFFGACCCTLWLPLRQAFLQSHCACCAACERIGHMQDSNERPCFGCWELAAQLFSAVHSASKI